MIKKIIFIIAFAGIIYASDAKKVISHLANAETNISNGNCAAAIAEYINFLISFEKINFKEFNDAHITKLRDAQKIRNQIKESKCFDEASWKLAPDYVITNQELSLEQRLMTGLEHAAARDCEKATYQLMRLKTEMPYASDKNEQLKDWYIALSEQVDKCHSANKQ